MDSSDAPHKRALELLRKRYRLPVSVIVHAIPPDYLSAWEESDGRVTGLVTSEDDAHQLTERCQSIGFSEIRLRYAEFISLRCAGAMASLISDPPLTLRVLNPPVAKEKLRLFSVLSGHRVRLEEALLEVQAEGKNLQELILLRCKLANERERPT
nr:unnamed protein product [Digitaria exilis]